MVERRKNRIDPTIRSFMDLRRGLLGPYGKSGDNQPSASPENQALGGRVLCTGSNKETHRKFGETRERKVARRDKH